MCALINEFSKLIREEFLYQLEVWLSSSALPHSQARKFSVHLSHVSLKLINPAEVSLVACLEIKIFLVHLIYICILRADFAI